MTKSDKSPEIFGVFGKETSVKLTSKDATCQVLSESSALEQNFIFLHLDIKFVALVIYTMKTTAIKRTISAFELAVLAIHPILFLEERVVQAYIVVPVHTDFLVFCWFCFSSISVIAEC